MGVLAKASGKAERTDNALFSAIYTYVRSLGFAACLSKNFR